LVDKNAREKILRVADIQPEDAVLEVGPGLGALTCRLVELAGQVAAIEKDPARYGYFQDKK
jgi:16S rRNA (adenine1518-N6/adenine1519-N6)-dimethyltransferase